MTNFEKLISDKEAIVHIIDDADNHLYEDVILKWYCNNKCESKSCATEKGCDCDLASEEFIRLWLEAEAE